MAKEITDANFSELLAEGKPLVVDFWAPWCGPCKMIAPIFDELAAEYEGKIIAGKLNVDDNDETCSAYGIMNIPTILFFKNGELVHRQVGAIRKPDLQSFLKRYCNIFAKKCKNICISRKKAVLLHANCLCRH